MACCLLGVLVGGQVVAGCWLEVSAVVAAAMAAAIADAVNGWRVWGMLVVVLMWLVAGCWFWLGIVVLFFLFLVFLGCFGRLCCWLFMVSGSSESAVGRG